MSAAEKAKLAAVEKKRKEMMDAFAAQKQDLINESARNRTGTLSAPGIHLQIEHGRSQWLIPFTGADRFTSKTDGVDEALKKSTYGLVQLQDFKETREKLEEQARREAAGTAELKYGQLECCSESLPSDFLNLRRPEEKRKKKKKKESKVKLSFDDGEDDEGGEIQNSNGKDSEEDRPAKKAKVGKNPTVDTHFLPDREREEAERKIRDELRKEWLQKQEDMKREDIEITYSYWDGSGHRKQVTCKKGDSVAQFLEKCRQQFPELRGVSVDNLMYIKEDLIIPHHYTFYDFIINKYRGKSGPLFNFDVHDDVRLIADASVEKDEASTRAFVRATFDIDSCPSLGSQSHAGKVVERAWYNRNKHIFPASRWEVFNPAVVRTKYTIHGD
ncbi:hypothetical protein OIV83_002487 [Microbotryomycetes sp. JL201]|nr:hypothetical protein OIV83_002487 [Microbotryomycetes sp. JL201]